MTATAIDTLTDEPQVQDERLEHIVVVGAGISGIAMAIELQRRGIDDFCLLEASDRPGGTWRDNNYPGVAVDIPSLSYCFPFEPNPDWSRLFAPGAEIYRYIEHCVDKYDIRRRIRFGARVNQAVFDPARALWSLHLTDGRRIQARYVVVATGILNQPKLPEIAGRDDFRGRMFHTSRWDQGCDLAGKRVAIIGTGASAAQVVPAIARDVARLDVWQRTPIWVLPKLDIRFPARLRRVFRAMPMLQRLMRAPIDGGLEMGYWATVYYRHLPGLTRLAERNSLKLLASQVSDPALRDKLTPHYGFGCKRPAVSSEYWATFERDNVTLRTEGIESIDAAGIIDGQGTHHRYDAIILATGFKTQEIGNNPSFEVHGLDGLELGRFWHEHRYQAFNGVSVPRFPNLFLTFGPYSGGLNWFTMIGANGRFIGRCLQKADRNGARYVEVRRSYHDRYLALMHKKARNTLFQNGPCQGANSYYFDRHGDASLPTPFAPIWRWFRVRVTGLQSHRFEREIPPVVEADLASRGDLAQLGATGPEGGSA